MKVTFEGKTALVTGAGAGIGKAIAEAFSSLGAKLAIAEINPKHCETLRKEFQDALVVETDVRKVDQVDALKKKIEDKFGHIDILVNNVGHHLGLSKPLVQQTEEDWDRIYDINLRHMFVVSRAMIPLLQKTG